MSKDEFMDRIDAEIAQINANAEARLARGTAANKARDEARIDGIAEDFANSYRDDAGERRAKKTVAAVDGVETAIRFMEAQRGPQAIDQEVVPGLFRDANDLDPRNVPLTHDSRSVGRHLIGAGMLLEGTSFRIDKVSVPRFPGSENKGPSRG